MLGLITVIVGFIFIALLIRAIYHTIIGVTKIILGLILIGLSHICDFFACITLNIRYFWARATINKGGPW